MYWFSFYVVDDQGNLHWYENFMLCDEHLKRAYSSSLEWQDVIALASICGTQIGVA